MFVIIIDLKIRKHDILKNKYVMKDTVVV